MKVIDSLSNDFELKRVMIKKRYNTHELSLKSLNELFKKVDLDDLS